MHVAGQWISALLTLYLVVLIARIVLDYTFMFARSWEPRGVALVVVEGVFTLTDPPLKLLRRVIPPLRIGQVSLDLAFMVLFLIVVVLIQVTGQI